MLDFIQNSTSPIFAAFLLGLLFAFDTCQMLANIAAINYIFRDLTNKKRLIIKCLYFMFGKILLLVVLGSTIVFLIKSGLNILKFGDFFIHYWEIILISVLIIFGFLLFFSHKIYWLKFMFYAEKIEKNAKKNNFGIFLLGAVLSLAFCPTNAILFFGILIPLSLSVSYGFFTLPFVFSLTTALPIIIITLIFIFSIKNLDKFYKITDKYSKIAIKVTGILLILAALFLLIEHFLHTH